MKWFTLPAALLMAALCASAQAGLLDRFRGMAEEPAAPEAVMEAEPEAAAPAPVQTEMDRSAVWSGESTVLAPECCESARASWCKSLWARFCSAKCFHCLRPRRCECGCQAGCGKCRGLGLKPFLRLPATPLFGGPCCRPACPMGYRSAAEACCDSCCGAPGCGGCGADCCGRRPTFLGAHGCLLDCLKPHFHCGLFSRRGRPTCGPGCGCGQPGCPECGREAISSEGPAYYGPEAPADAAPAPTAAPQPSEAPADAAPAPSESKSARRWLPPSRFHLLPTSLRSR